MKKSLAKLRNLILNAYWGGCHNRANKFQPSAKQDSGIIDLKEKKKKKKTQNGVRDGFV